jgi:hypothetical protein
MNPLLLVSVFFGLAVVFVLIRLSIGAPVIRIESPRFAILDLSGGADAGLVEEDKNALSDILGSPVESASSAPSCDVLFIYGRLDAAGAFEREPHGLREIIRDSGAKVVVVASENVSDNYIKATPRKAYGNANLVMTLSRRGGRFAAFFRELFARMKSGTSMPVAWVALAPQIPNEEHPSCPDTIFACEAGQVSFG